MSLSKPPEDGRNHANPGISQSFDFRNRLAQTGGQNNVNQIRGINRQGSTGSGIPKQVTNVSTSIANASTGSTSTITVIFSRDPSDANFSGVTVFVKGYQGNPSPVQIASGTDSPITFIVNNTGEALSLIVQAFGNGGAAPLGTAPTVGISLPKSTGGGTGTTTVTSAPVVSGTAVPGQLAVFATPATTVTGGNLSGDATTSGSTVVTVGKLRGVSIGTGTPFDQQVLRYVSANTDWEPSLGIVPFFTMHTVNAAASGVAIGALGFYNNGSGAGATASSIAATATLPPAQQVKTTNLGSTTVASVFATASSGGTLVPGFRNFRQIVFKLSLLQVTNMRVWIGLGSSTSTTVMASDTPNVSFVGFRFSTAAADAKYKCITQTSNVAQTVNAETTASHVDTSLHTFELRWDDTNVIFLIDGVQVGSQNANLPAAATGLFPMIMIDNVNTANAQGFNFYFAAGVGRPF